MVIVNGGEGLQAEVMTIGTYYTSALIFRARRGLWSLIGRVFLCGEGSK
jgi:hypothetical protein